MSIEQKTALITGASQGMGVGVAHRLAAQGVQVLINDIDPDEAEAAAQANIADGGKALA